MKENKYQETINKIKATESFKSNTIKKMKNELNNQYMNVPNKDSEIKDKIINLNNKGYGVNKYKNIGTIAASFILIVVVMILVNKPKDKINEYVDVNKEQHISDSKTNIVDKNQSSIEENSDNINTEELAGLPKLTVFSEFGGMGFGALMAYSVDELESGNPWTEECNITELPVFKNTVFSDNPAEPPKNGLTAEEMLNSCRRIAESMGLSIDKEYTSPTEEESKAYEEKSGREVSKTPSMAFVESDGVTIRTDSVGGISINFENPIKLPDEYNTFKWYSTESEAKKNLEYLMNKYNYIIDMKSPEISLFGDYTYSGEQYFRYNIYEGDGELIDKILGYNFNIASFSPSHNGGELSSISIIKTNLSELVGNYPIISAEEAKELLLNGNYITSVPVDLKEELKGEDYISAVELIYRKSPAYDEYLMPYYEFLVEIPSMKLDNGLKTFGIYYVPAVKSEYISNMPLYKGQFN